MSPFFPSRSRTGHDPQLGPKMVIFAIGAAFGVAGIATGVDVLIYIGIAILVVGLLLRFRRVETEEDEGT